LIVRQEQIDYLDEARWPHFETYMVAHLRDFSPLHSKSLGEAGIRRLIQAGVQRALAHGFSHRASVKLYIETMILLGADFDTDPQYPGAKAALDEPMPAEMDRADCLHAWLTDLLDKVGGPDRRFAKEALRRARDIPFQPIPVSSPNFMSEIIAQIKRTHPEKFGYVGEPAIRNLILRAQEEAQKYFVATDGGVCLFAGLMFAVGHGFVSDPKYPWILNTLSNAAITDPAKRVERLYSKTMTYLDQVLEHLRDQ
jgi:hypothetical protein